MIIRIFALGIVLFLMAAHSSRTYELESLPQYWSIVQSGDNYRIIRICENDFWEMRYELLSNDGRIAKYFETSRPAWIEHVGENIVGLTVSAGTNVRWSQFYMVSDDVSSEVFHNAILTEGETIAFMALSDDDRRKLVVRDIFDTGTFYQEFFLDEIAPGKHHTHSTGILYLGDGAIKIIGMAYDGNYDAYVVISERSK